MTSESATRVYVVTLPMPRTHQSVLPTEQRLTDMFAQAGGVVSWADKVTNGWRVGARSVDGDKAKMTRNVKRECAFRGWDVTLT